MSQALLYMKALRGDPKVRMEEGIYYLLADAGYSPSTVLLTTPTEGITPGTPMGEYYKEHCTTRSLVERTIGAVSGVWRAINRENKLHYTPIKVAKIITSCAILHNFRKMHGLPDPEQTPETSPSKSSETVHELNEDYYAGLAERDFIVDYFYNK
ncbi:hypothetical protein QAD02_013431 [Eretmocerus hayati]|uniref:Uncharacterized protein n=1 Tax=Eretmocerus hayati TaxID=131215 RepID=A0ACC2P527_9HYME|nr:hypothetical protein QAD02_013431 [Eretmocerus hayati]